MDTRARWFLVLGVAAAALSAQPDSLPLMQARADAGVETVDGSRLAALLARFDVDRRTLERSTVALTDARRERMRAFYQTWQRHLDALPYGHLTVEERVDWHLLAGQLRWQLADLDQEVERAAACAPLLPFADAILGLAQARREVQAVDPAAAAELLVRTAEQVRATRAALQDTAPDTRPSAIVAWRAADRVGTLVRLLEDWHRFRDGYDPAFSWWLRAPFPALRDALRDYGGFLRRELAGVTGERGDAILGDPIGEAALTAALLRERIPYTPAELVAVAEREYAWCQKEMLEASAALGFGADWRRCLDHVKDLHVEPGEQPALIQALAEEAVAFLEDRDLLTIPTLAKETWRMRMMTPQRQKVNPYFTGGEVISVSFPTDTMAHADKRMSLRGNNRHFSRATVHHELIPGHHLQQFMTARHRPWRQPFGTPFWLEGWALYWELRLWDLGFASGPEDEVGMLFWRMHRCARIVFSLSFHLGHMDAQACVDYLVQKVGHERRNAEAEVRRSVRGDYSPLYQAAYLLGGLQLRALHAELVEAGAMTEKAFHDAVLRQGSLPIELLRAALTDTALAKDAPPTWRFYAGL